MSILKPVICNCDVPITKKDSSFCAICDKLILKDLHRVKTTVPQWTIIDLPKEDSEFDERMKLILERHSAATPGAGSIRDDYGFADLESMLKAAEINTDIPEGLKIDNLGGSRGGKNGMVTVADWASGFEAETRPIRIRGKLYKFIAGLQIDFRYWTIIPTIGINFHFPNIDVAWLCFEVELRIDAA